MENVNKVLYESKLIGYPKPFKNKVRTFCQNPGGFVSQENYDDDLAVVNGHSFKDKKSNNTNVAILCSHNFSYPFNQPIAYAQKVGELTNMLGAGHIMVQRFGDILDGKRTWEKELAQSNVRPTLTDAVAGDITAAMPYRSMMNIINFIQAVDHVVPGFASTETLLYSPELKFYSNRIKMDKDLNTNIPGLHCLGDSSGWTRGLMMASIMGVRQRASRLLCFRRLCGRESPEDPHHRRDQKQAEPEKRLYPVTQQRADQRRGKIAGFPFYRAAQRRHHRGEIRRERKHARVDQNAEVFVVRVVDI